jgi:hypothetical protein
MSLQNRSFCRGLSANARGNGRATFVAAARGHLRILLQ